MADQLLGTVWKKDSEGSYYEEPQHLPMGTRNIPASQHYWNDYHAGLAKYRREFFRMHGVLIWHESGGLTEQEAQQANRDMQSALHPRANVDMIGNANLRQKVAASLGL